MKPRIQLISCLKITNAIGHLLAELTPSITGRNHQVSDVTSLLLINNADCVTFSRHMTDVTQERHNITQENSPTSTGSMLTFLR